MNEGIILDFDPRAIIQPDTLKASRAKDDKLVGLILAELNELGTLTDGAKALARAYKLLRDSKPPRFVKMLEPVSIGDVVDATTGRKIPQS